MSRLRPAKENTQFKKARKALLSPSGSGRAMSRQELADAGNAFLARWYQSQGRRPRWAGLTERSIGAIERGENRWPNEDYRMALCAVLKADERSLGLFIDRTTPEDREAATDPARVAVPGVSPSPSPVLIDRRTLLTTALPAASAAGLSSSLLWHLAAQSVELMGENSTGYANDTLASARRHLRKATTDYALTSDLPAAIAGALTTRALLAPLQRRGGLPLRETQELYVLQGATCLLLASVSHDFGESAAGMMHAEAAGHFAELADHSELAGWVNCTKAMVDLWRDRPAAALKHAARPTGRRSDSHRLRGLQVRALAQLGRRSDAMTCLALLEGARDSFGEVGELNDLGAMFTFPEGRQKYYSAVTYAILGECGTAEEYVLDLGYTEIPPVGAKAWPVSWALSRSHLALARLSSASTGGDPEAAADAVAPVLALPRGQRINQLAQVFEILGKRLNAPQFRTTAAATMLREQVHHFLSDTVQRGDGSN